jgi:DNA-binding transcriptional LysR family regulator
MRRNELGEISVFVAVVKHKGFRAAAKILNLQAGSVSQALQRLEDRLDYQLLNRTTRQISLTEEGRTLFNRASPAIADIEDAIRELDGMKDKISGTLRLNAPRAVGTCFLDALLSEYVIKYYDVKLEIAFQDDKIDLVESGIDAAIRIAGLLDKDTYAVPIGPELNMAVVVSPNYIKKFGVPQHPTEINNHRGVCYKQNSSTTIYGWQFKEGNKKYSVSPKQSIIVNDSDSILRFVQDNAGIGYVYKHDAQYLIDCGKCVQILQNHTYSQGRYSINYITKKHMPKRLRAFINLARAFSNR